MISIWSERAKKSLHIVENYILREFGEDKRSEFMTEAEQVAIQLEQFPNLGKLEPLLTHRRKPYRSYLVTRRTKMIYYIDNEHERVIISDIWDIRREPKTASKGL